jgi:hypothetical protein
VLKAANPGARQCYERALKAKVCVLEATDPFAREEFLASEMRWLKLAENYELSERLTYFLNRPPVFPKHPICPNCHVPMWLLEIQSRSEKVEFFYECKVCEAKETVTGSNDCHARNKTSREVPAAHNACLAALSPAAFASLKPYLTYSTETLSHLFHNGTQDRVVERRRAGIACLLPDVGARLDYGFDARGQRCRSW